MNSPIVVTYGNATVPRHHRRVASVHPFDESVARLKTAIERADLWLIHEIDPQLLLRRGGFAIARARQLFFFHPRLMVRLLAADPGGLPEVPLKLVVTEDADGSCFVTSVLPSFSFAPYPRLADLSAELSTLCTSLISSVEATPT